MPPRHTLGLVAVLTLAAAAIDLPGQCTSRPYSLTVTGAAPRSEVTLVSRGTATLYLDCFAHLPVATDPACEDFLEDASIRLVRRLSNASVPISSWTGTSLHGVAYYFDNVEPLSLIFEVPSLPNYCHVTWWYDYRGSTARRRVTDEPAPAPIEVVPSVIRIGEPVTLVYKAAGGALDGARAALVPFGQRCRSVTEGSATLAPVTSSLVPAAVGFSTTFHFQGEYLVCLDVGGRFREVSYVYAYGGNPYYFKMEGLAGGGYYTLNRPYTIEFFGDGLNTAPGGDAAKLVSISYDCEGPAGGGVPLATNLGPADSAGVNYSTWRVTITTSGSYRVCYRRVGAAWGYVPLFDSVPTNAHGGPTVDPGEPTTSAPLPSTTPFTAAPPSTIPTTSSLTTAPPTPTTAPPTPTTAPPSPTTAPRTPTTAPPSPTTAPPTPTTAPPTPTTAPPSPTTAPPPTPTACVTPAGCPLIVGGVVRILATLSTTEYPPQFASTLADMMCLLNVNPLRVQVTRGSTPGTLSAVVGLECSGETSWCHPVEPLSALLCTWQLSQGDPKGSLRALFDSIHVVDMTVTTGAITANTSDTRLSPIDTSPTAAIIGASVATIVVVLGITVVALVLVYRRCRRRAARVPTETDSGFDGSPYGDSAYEGSCASLPPTVKGKTTHKLGADSTYESASASPPTTEGREPHGADSPSVQ